MIYKYIAQSTSVFSPFKFGAKIMLLIGIGKKISRSKYFLKRYYCEILISRLLACLSPAGGMPKI